MSTRYNRKPPSETCAWRTLAALVICLVLLQPVIVRGGPVTGQEYDVKIGFIYNFAKFITWPQAAYDKDPGYLVFCFASDDPSLEVFYKLEGKIIKGRKIKVVAYQQGDCLEISHILFFATQDKTFIQQVLEKAKGHSILTIGQVDGFTRWGGVINFFEENNHLRFKINIDAARREGLKMSSQLLGSAQIVREEHK